ncbi:MAG: response regulator transcription factor [Actinopolymorphaceae bacterium]
MLGGLVVTAIFLTVTLVAAHRRGHTNQWVARVASVAVLALSAEGMWMVARERLHLPVVLAAAVFFVAEALMVSAALQARRHYERTTEHDPDGRLIRPGHPGPHGRAVWVILVELIQIVTRGDWLFAKSRGKLLEKSAVGRAELKPDRSAIDLRRSARLVTRDHPGLLDRRQLGLTEREREVPYHIGRGHSNDEISAALHITAATARTYVSRLLAKLHARDRSQLVVRAYEAGLTHGPH